MHRFRVLSGFLPVFFLAILLLGILPGSARAKEVTIHGFVTEVKSATEFEIDDYKVTSNSSIVFNLSNQDAKTQASFKPEDVRVGTELEIKGELEEGTGQLTAKSIKVFLDEARPVKRTALLEQMPALSKQESGWTGELFADGQKISVTPATVLTVKVSEAQRKALGAKDDHVPLTSLETIDRDTFIRYEGTRGAGGTVVAQKVEFEHGEMSAWEEKVWKRYDPKVKDPDYENFAPGELKMHWKKYRLVPNQEAQAYVAALGRSLIPEHQRDLPADSPFKIPFRFYLVEDKTFNASCYPNGVVIVHSGVFEVLQNEAQLAFVLSHEISHAVEKHEKLEHELAMKPGMLALRYGGAFIPAGGGLATGMVASSIQSQYSRSLENQADRVGLEWMLAAGYDVREAPASWKAVSLKKGDQVTIPFWASHDNHTTRRSYLMAELRNNYADVDFSKLRKDSERFHYVARVVADTEQKEKKGK